VPISDLSCLQNSAFWALSLRNLPARDLSPLFTSRWLVTLRVEGMNVQDLRWVGKFEHINRIFAPRNPIRSLNGLEAIKSRVMNVDVSQTQVSDLSPIQGATHLRWIELNDTRVSDLTPLASCVDLRSAELDRTPLRALHGLPTAKLNSLSISGTRVDDLSHLKSAAPLRSLDISHTPVTDLTPIHDCRRLGELRIIGTEISEAQIKAFQDAVPRCDVITEEDQTATDSMIIVSP
jgi:internalin A